MIVVPYAAIVYIMKPTNMLSKRINFSLSSSLTLGPNPVVLGPNPVNLGPNPVVLGPNPVNLGSNPVESSEPDLVDYTDQPSKQD